MTIYPPRKPWNPLPETSLSPMEIPELDSPAPEQTPPAARTVLVTGVGGPAGVAVVEALKAGGETVVGVDADVWASGYALCDTAVEVPYANSTNYMPILRNIITAHNVDVIIPTTVEEMEPLTAAIAEGALPKVGVVVPTPEALHACMDKHLFARTLTENGVLTPPTFRAGETVHATVDLPPAHWDGWITKPCTGRGSRGITTYTGKGLSRAIVQTVEGDPSLILQPRIVGDEFTCDTFTDDTHTSFVSARWRLATKAGISTVGETFQNARVTDAVSAALRSVGCVGPACVQGFVTRDGTVYVVEINARFGGGLSLTVYAGANIPMSYVRVARGETTLCEARGSLAVLPGVKMTRRFAAAYQIPASFLRERTFENEEAPTPEGWHTG